MILTQVSELNCSHPHTIISAKDEGKTTEFPIKIVCLTCKKYAVVVFQ